MHRVYDFCMKVTHENSYCIQRNGYTITGVEWIPGAFKPPQADEPPKKLPPASRSNNDTTESPRPSDGNIIIFYPSTFGLGGIGKSYEIVSPRCFYLRKSIVKQKELSLHQHEERFQTDVWMGDGPSSHNTTGVLSLNLDVDGCLKEWEKKQSLEAVRGRSIGRQINLSTNSMLVTVPTSLPSPLANNDKLCVAPATTTLKFVLEKQLTKCDVRTSSRIVLPKKQAEAKLPILNDKWGITLIVRDALSSDKWKMKYRYWPNNNSKMYVLENTGGFIRKNKLNFGDYVAIYQDDNNDNYICARKIDRPPFPLELAAYTDDGRMGDNQTTMKSDEHLEAREQASSMCNFSTSGSLEMASSSDDGLGLGVEDDLTDFRRQPIFDDLDLSFFDSNRPGDYLSNRCNGNK